MINEGKIVKGGVNDRPKSKRPSPPKGQGYKRATFRGTVFYIGSSTDSSDRIRPEDIGKERAV